VRQGEVLAYLAGIVDGDGYLKLTPNWRTPGTSHPYYASVIGLQQLWPIDAVRLFATSFGAHTRTESTRGQRIISRCEIQGGKAEAALRRILPFLLLKRSQAILLLEVAQFRPHRRGRASLADTAYDRMRIIRRELLNLHEGSRPSTAEALPVDSRWSGYPELSPDALGWSREQLHAYLAGIIDSDGNLRVEKRHAKGMISPHYRISVRCAQVSPSPALELLGRVFGGRPTLKRSRKLNHRDLVCWSAHDKCAAVAIRALLPHLPVKWAEACLLLELRQLKAQGKEGLTECVHRTRWQRPIKMRKRCYTSEQVAQFERIRRAVQALHSPDPIDRNRLK